MFGNLAPTNADDVDRPDGYLVLGGWTYDVHIASSTWVAAVRAPVRGVSAPVISRGKDGVRRENLDLRFAWDA
jgi:hypothetical protein